MKTRMQYAVLAVGALALLAACATTSLRSVDPATDFDATRLHRVMVIGVFKNQELRRSFETEFARQWKAKGADVISSLDVLPAGTPLEKAGVAPIAKAQGFDAVVVSRLIGRTHAKAGQQAVRTVDPSNQNEIQNVNTVLQILLAPPVYARDHDLAAVQTNIYGVAAEKRVWSGVTETAMVGRIPELIPPFVKVILNEIYSKK